MSVIRTLTPLRLGLAGGGTDLPEYALKYGCSVLNVTLCLYIHCTLITNDRGIITLISQEYGKEYSSKVQPELPIDGNLDIHKSVYNKIIKKFNIKPFGFTLTTCSDVPSGSGLGGSSALVVGILKAFIELLNLSVDEYQLAEMAFEIERKDLKIIGGFQDQYAAAFGGFNYIKLEHGNILVNQLRIRDWIVNELKTRVILYFTNITRDASQIESEKKALSKDVVSLNSMHKVKQLSEEIKNSLLVGDLDEFSRLISESWNAKKHTSSKVSNPQIDEIYDAAINNGAICGKVSGAGGGGFMFFICEPRERFNLITTLRKFNGRLLGFDICKNGSISWRVINE